MILKGLPGWAWPTRTAKTLHYFPAEGEASLCRRYFAGVVAAFDWPREDLVTEKGCCAACWKRAPRPGDPSHEAIDAARYRERMGDLEGADDEDLAHTPRPSDSDHADRSQG